MSVTQWLELEGAANARDVGGLPAAGGLATRPGVLLRSDAVHQLTAADVELLVGRLGLRLVVDLRADGERRTQERGLLGRSGVAYCEVEVITDAHIAERRLAREAAMADGRDPAIVTAEGYLEMMELGRPALAAAFGRLVEADGTPALVHCSAGKDRTGVLVALLLDAAGVDREAIVADYAATGERIALVRDRLAQMPQYAQLAAEAPAPLLAAHRETMEHLLDQVHARRGGGAGWFEHAGVHPTAISRWRDLILERP